MEEENKIENFFARKEVWISFAIGLIIGMVLLYLLGLIPTVGNKIGTASKTIIKTKNGNINKDDLYEEMVKSYPISYLLELIDRNILEKKYSLTKEQEEEVMESMDRILEQYKNYGYTEEQFYAQSGFADRDDFVNYMKLNYRRNLYYKDYYKGQIPEEERKEYYENNNIYGTINTKHILVEVSEDRTEADAIKMAKEVISKLNSGKDIDEVANEYGDEVVFENVSFDSFDEASIATEYVEASKSLNAGEYTKEAVKTDFGYHIIYCISKEDKPSYEQVEDKILDTLSNELSAGNQNIADKALIELRKENGLEIEDKTLKKLYEDYCNEINQ